MSKTPSSSRPPAGRPVGASPPGWRLRGIAARLASLFQRDPFDWSDPGRLGIRHWTASPRRYMVAPAVVGPGTRVRRQGAGRRCAAAGAASWRGADSWGESRFGLDMRSAEEAVRRYRHWSGPSCGPTTSAQNFDEDLFPPRCSAGNSPCPPARRPNPSSTSRTSPMSPPRC